MCLGAAGWFEKWNVTGCVMVLYLIKTILILEYSPCLKMKHNHSTLRTFALESLLK